MGAYKHILLATDLRPGADRCAERVQALAASCGAKLSIVHSRAAPAISLSGEMSIPDPGGPKLQAEAEAELMAFGERHGVASEDTHLLQGDPILVIADLARDIGADLVALGYHQRGLIGALIGDTAKKILKKLHCDALVIRTDSEMDIH